MNKKKVEMRPIDRLGSKKDDEYEAGENNINYKSPAYNMSTRREQFRLSDYKGKHSSIALRDLKGE